MRVFAIRKMSNNACWFIVPTIWLHFIGKSGIDIGINWFKYQLIIVIRK